MEIEILSPDERPNSIKGFGKRGALDGNTIALHLRLLASLNAIGTFPTSFASWLPKGYSSTVYYHRDVLDAGLVEIYPRFRVTQLGLEYVQARQPPRDAWEEAKRFWARIVSAEQLSLFGGVAAPVAPRRSPRGIRIRRAPRFKQLEFWARGKRRERAKLFA